MNSPPDSWRAYLTDMSKRVLIILLVAVLAFIGCRRKTEQKESSRLPSLWITMTPLQLDSILIDQDNKVAAEVLFLDTQGDTLFQGRLNHIKTRGNTTLKNKKKPYAIKFPQKQSFLGLERSKSFVLLANAFDESHIRNAIGLDLARLMGIPAPRYAYLSLYINGDYEGLYQMTNKVDVGKRALDITDLDKLNERANPKPLEEYEWFGLGREKTVVQRKGVLLDNNPEDITGGYLLDNTGPPNQYSKSISGFVSAANDNLRITSPQYASPQELDYIAERYNEMESAVQATDGFNPQTGKHYTDYLDLASFVRYYLLNEILFNFDAGWTSFMMFKDRDGIDPKFHAGPAWDFDRTLNNPKFTDDIQLVLSNNEIYVDRKHGKNGVAFSGGLFHHMCRHEDFQQAVRDCYLNEISPVCHEYLEASSFDSLAVLLASEAERDNEVHHSRHSKDYASAIARATDFLRNRISFFDWYYASTQEEQVLINIEWEEWGGRKFYYPLGEAIATPQVAEVWYNHDPVYELFYAGTDSLVPSGTVFHEPQTLELRQRMPTKREVQMRRVKKKLAKIGIDF